MSLKQFLKGAVVGGAICGGLALLLAPRKGSETKEQLINKLQENENLIKEVEQQIDNVQTNFASLKHLGESLVPETADAVKDDISELKFRLNPRLKELKRQRDKIILTLENIKQTFEEA